jgi:hypothetical protein
MAVVQGNRKLFGLPPLPKVEEPKKEEEVLVFEPTPLPVEENKEPLEVVKEIIVQIKEEIVEEQAQQQQVQEKKRGKKKTK